MDGIKGSFDSFRVEEAYNWRDDIMEITRRIVHETDEARLNNITEHFKVDLSEIREFLEMKRKKTQKPQTNADKIRSMTDEELAGWLERIRLCCATDLCGRRCPFAEVCYSNAEAPKEMHDWLKAPVEPGEVGE